MLKILLIIAVAFVLFELAEHVILPVIWLILNKRRRSPSGESGMIGLVAEVRELEGTKGKVFVRGELWQAESEDYLQPGDEAVVQSVKRLRLIVKRLEK